MGSKFTGSVNSGTTASSTAASGQLMTSDLSTVATSTVPTTHVQKKFPLKWPSTAGEKLATKRPPVVSRKSRLIQYGLNLSAAWLNQEFSSLAAVISQDGAFADGTAILSAAAGPREERARISFVGNLPAGDSVPLQAVRQILIGEIDFTGHRDIDQPRKDLLRILEICWTGGAG
jgi:hypothetical protein